MVDLQQCTEIINALPQSERLDRALWLLDQMKTGPMGRRILSDFQTEYMLRCMRARLTQERDDSSD